MLTPEQKRQNLRTGLILLTVVLTLLVGFVVKMVWLGH